MKRAGTTVGGVPGFEQLEWTYRTWSVRRGVSSLKSPLLIGASLGGNITPIGASANIVACGLLKKEGYRVSFSRFMKIGIPFTVVAVAAASVFVWFVWA